MTLSLDGRQDGVLGTAPRRRQAEPGSLLERLQRHARLQPHGTALVFPLDGSPSQTLSWTELNERVSSMGGYLRANGAGEGDVVVVISASVREQVLGFLGAMAAGCLPTIVSYPSAKQSESAFASMLRPLIERARPRLVLASPTFAPSLAGCCALESLLAFPDSSRLQHGAEIWPRALSHEHFLQFSSGTTGLRKAVAVSGTMLQSQVAAYARAIDLRPDDAVVSWLPLYHDMGLVAALLCSLWHGIKSVHCSPFDWLVRPELLLEWISEHRATLVWLPNFAYDLCAERIAVGESSALRLDSLRAVINCSEPVRERSHQRFLAAFAPLGLRAEQLQTCYAMAETTFAVTQSRIGSVLRSDRIDRVRLAAEHRAVQAHEDAAAASYVSCGRVLEGTSVRIAGATGDRSVGEIEVRSPSAFAGYWRGDAALDPFTTDGWYRTGDLGYLADGDLFVTGRSKDLIINRGQNIYPNDVEEVLAEVRGCKPGRAVVFGVENERTSTEDIVVMLERRGTEHDVSLLKQEVRELVLDRLGIGLTDVVVCEPNTLLKSTSGKLSRSKNRALYREQHAPTRLAASAAPPAPADDDTRVLLEIWQRALGSGPIDVRARLFAELGADSLSAMRAVGEIARAFKVTISASDLLQEDTIARQASWLQRRRASSVSRDTPDPILVKLQDGDDTPLFLLHPAGGRALPYTTLLAHLSPNRPVYAFQAPELFGPGPHLGVAHMVQRYLELLLRTQPSGPYLLAGWSFGGLLAYELACQLEAAAHRVAQLVLFDTDPPLPTRQRLERLARHAVARAAVARGLEPPVGVLRHGNSAAARFLAVLPSELDRPEQLSAVARYVAGRRLASATGPAPSMAETWEALLALLHARSDPEEMRGFFVPELDAPGLLRGSRLLVKNRYLSWSHVPRRQYRGPMTIFAAAQPDRLSAWQPYCASRLVVQSYPVRPGRVLAPHFVMLDATNVALFGRDLNDLLAGRASKGGAK